MKNEYDGTSAKWNKDTPQPASGVGVEHVLSELTAAAGVIVGAIAAALFMPIVAVIGAIGFMLTVVYSDKNPDLAHFKNSRATWGAIAAGVSAMLTELSAPLGAALSVMAVWAMIVFMIRVRQRNQSKREI